MSTLILIGAILFIVVLARAFVSLLRWYAVKGRTPNGIPIEPKRYKQLMDAYISMGFGLDISLTAFKDHTTGYIKHNYCYHAMLFSQPGRKVGSGMGITAEHAAFNAIQDYTENKKKRYSPYRIHEPARVSSSFSID